MNKFDEVEELARKLECDYDTAWDLVYLSDEIWDDDETDDAL